MVIHSVLSRNAGLLSMQLERDEVLLLSKFDEVKSRKYQGVFEVKSRAKTWQVRGIWSQQLEH